MVGRRGRAADGYGRLAAHVELVALGEDEGVVHQLEQRRGVMEVVVRVRGEEGLVLVVAENRGGQRVEGDHVGDLFGAWLLDDVAVHHVGLRQQPMLDFCERELRSPQVARSTRRPLSKRWSGAWRKGAHERVAPYLRRDGKLGEKIVELGLTDLAIGFAHRSQTGCDGRLGERIQLDRPRERHARGEAAETHLDELLRIEGAVPVAALGNGFR